MEIYIKCSNQRNKNIILQLNKLNKQDIIIQWYLINYEYNSKGK